MRLAEIAERVLRAVGEPMHSPEIVAFARRRGWLSTRGYTPEHSLQAALWKEINKNGSRSRFVMVGKDTVRRKYWLRDLGKKQ